MSGQHAAFTESSEEESLDPFAFLAIGLPIEVQVPLQDSELTDVYFSQIMDLDARGIHISTPQRQGQVTQLFDSGDPVYIRIGLDGAFYTCLCHMLGWSGLSEGMVLSLPRQVRRLQRRRFMRIAASLPVTLKVLTQGPDLPSEWLPAVTTDLSGGGMMIRSAIELPVYTETEVRLSLPTDGNRQARLLVFRAQICRCVTHETGYQLGLSFDEMSDNLRDRLISFIFCLEREIIRSKSHLAPGP